MKTSREDSFQQRLQWASLSYNRRFMSNRLKSAVYRHTQCPTDSSLLYIDTHTHTHTQSYTDTHTHTHAYIATQTHTHTHLSPMHIHKITNTHGIHILSYVHTYRYTFSSHAQTTSHAYAHAVIHLHIIVFWIHGHTQHLLLMRCPALSPRFTLNVQQTQVCCI